MKVMIEIDLPDGQSIPDPEDIVRLTNPNWHCDWWHIDDVQELYLGDGEYATLTDEEAREVLELMAKYSDPCVGINWDAIRVWQEEIYNQREEEENVY